MCTKEGCEKCQTVFGSTPANPGPRLVYRACDWNCFNNWATYFINSGATIVPYPGSWSLAGVLLGPQAAAGAFRIQAEHYLLAERFEDAAKSFEMCGMWREAGEARRQSRQQYVTQVHVDVNSLIEQLRRGSISTTYTCPACKSPIQINPETSVSSLERCQFCGSAIQITDLARFLSRVVGYR